MKAKFVLAIKQESNPNVREDDASMTTAIPVYAEGDVVIPNPELTRREYQPLSAFSGYKVVEFFKSWGSMKFSIKRPLPLEVPNFDGSDIDIMLQCSGHSRTILYETSGDSSTPIVGYEYMPDTDNKETMSIDIIGDELKYEGYGAKSAFSLLAQVGEPIMTEFALSAAYDDVKSGTFIVPFLSPPKASMIDENDIYGHVKIGATEVTAARSEIDEFSLDMGADVVQHKTFNKNGFRIKEFFPSISLKGDVDSENPYSIDSVLDGDTKALVVRIKDKSTLSDPADERSGKVKWEIVVSSMRADSVPSLSDKDGLGYLDQTFNANPTAGNDNYVLRYFI